MKKIFSPIPTYTSRTKDTLIDETTDAPRDEEGPATQSEHGQRGGEVRRGRRRRRRRGRRRSVHTEIRSTNGRGEGRLCGRSFQWIGLGVVRTLSSRFVGRYLRRLRRSSLPSSGLRSLRASGSPGSPSDLLPWFRLPFLRFWWLPVPPLRRLPFSDPSRDFGPLPSSRDKRPLLTAAG